LKKLSRLSKQARRQRGSGLLELGPALSLLFISLFFPLLDMISIAVTYGAGSVLNNLQARQCAVVTKTEAQDSNGLVMKGIPNQWKAMGLGRFCNLIGNPTTNLTYKPGQRDNRNRQDWVVVVGTTIRSRPFLTAPNLPGVPGLTAPMTFTFFSERVMENPDDANL
jgi:hypothetical protein